MFDAQAESNKTMRSRGSGRVWLVAGFVGACLLVVVFAIRLTFGAWYWSSHADQAIEGWMPVGYVARSWDVPRPVLAEAIGLAPGDAPRRSLSAIAAERGEPVEALIARLEAAIAAHRVGRGD